MRNVIANLFQKSLQKLALMAKSVLLFFIEVKKNFEMRNHNSSRYFQGRAWSFGAERGKIKV